jgi:hypothetical protein
LATVNIGNLTFTHKGDYASGTAYVKNDVVYYATNGNAYIAKQATTGNAPTNGTYWSQFAAGSGGIWNAGLSLGSAGQSVKVNAAGNALEFGTISSDFVKLGQANVSNATEAVFDGLFTSDYKMYKIYGYDIYSHVTSNDLQIRVNVSGSQNNSSVYNNTNWYVYTDTSPTHNINTQSSGSIDMNSPGSAWQLNTDDITNDSARPSFFELTLADPLAASKYKMAEWHHYHHGRNVDIMQSANGHGVWKNSSAISGIRIQGNNGNITGNFTLYGLKH